MVMEDENGYVALNTPNFFLNKWFGKLCLVDGLLLEYIEWKV